MTRVRPSDITVDREAGRLSIEWSDGRRSDYPLAGLRAVCPCVNCCGGHANMGKPADKELLHSAQDPELDLARIELVGSYAMQIVWSDSHDTGIYTWDYLYAAGS
ncbi:MAG: DUF971 domain-containing protein [Deltaproteobacteria bacterium]|nr:DUF971 domain-containing protein [Deltaproteobacteria bacterium]MBW2418086.1 DUF971 domain-containing protein [Deltaproteobacteria bacterium]